MIDRRPHAAASAHPLQSLSGSVLEERYRLMGILGTGGMGAVFEARHLRLDRRVAIKILRPNLAGQQQYTRRFLREAKAASKVRHRNVVEILDYGETRDGLVYSVMEFLVGQDLEQMLSREVNGRLPWRDAVDIAIQIASGLKAAHQEGVIHRDVKPANTFVTREDDRRLVKLVDFGIAKLDDADDAPQLTATDQVLGTPSYMAPELVRARTKATTKADIYSFGVLLYRMLTGHLPFVGDTIFEVWRAACFDPPPAPTKYVEDLPPRIVDFVHLLLSKSPEDRPESMGKVRRELVRLCDDSLSPGAVPIVTSEQISVATDAPPRSPISGEESKTLYLGGQTQIQAHAVEPTEALADVPDPDSQSTATVLAEPGELRADTASSGHARTVVAGPVRDGDRTFSNARQWLVFAFITTGFVTAFFAAASFFVAEDDSSVAIHEEPRQRALDDSKGDAEGPSTQQADQRVSTDGGASPKMSVSSGPMPQPEPEVGSTSEAVGTSASPVELPQVEVVEVVEPVETETEVAETESRPASSPNPRRERRGIADRPPKAKDEPKAVQPSDATLIARLKRNIQLRCATALGDGVTTVTFAVAPSGTVKSIEATPVGAAGYCAIAQVRGALFRPRFEDAMKSVTVQGRRRQPATP